MTQIYYDDDNYDEDDDDDDRKTVKNDDINHLDGISLDTRPGFRFSLIRGRVTG